jgi:hypothetical protein
LNIDFDAARPGGIHRRLSNPGYCDGHIYVKCLIDVVSSLVSLAAKQLTTQAIEARVEQTCMLLVEKVLGIV